MGPVGPWRLPARTGETTRMTSITFEVPLGMGSFGGNTTLIRSTEATDDVEGDSDGAEEVRGADPHEHAAATSGNMPATTSVSLRLSALRLLPLSAV